MVLGNFTAGGNNFRKKIMIRIWLSALIAVLGAITLGIIYSNNLFQSDEIGHLDNFTRGFYFGMGFGLVGAGIATIIKSVMYLKNKEKYKAAEIQDKDERNRFIGLKTGTLSAFIMFFTIYAATIVSGIYNVVVFCTLLSVLGAFAVVMFIVSIVLKKIY